MKHRKGVVLIALGVLLLLGAAGLTGYNLWDEQRAADSVEDALAQLEEIIPKPETVKLAPELVPDYVAAPMMEMPTVAVAGEDYLGYLTIPAIGISLPVLSQWSYPNLKRAPCRYTGSAYQNDLVLCAHNYQRHFGKLKDLNLGDRVEFVDVDGNLFRYQVVEVEQLEAYDITGMTMGDWDLSLFTCTLGGQYRVTVRCEKLAEEPA